MSRKALFAPLLCLFASAALADDFYLKDGDRVVFYGDSITEQRLYTTYVETFAVTRFPGMTVSFVHSGWGGDRVGGGPGGPVAKRLIRDVIAYKPTVVTIMLGMNDASYRPFDQGIFDQYTRGYQAIVLALKVADPGVRLTMIRPSPFDDVTRDPNFEGGYNGVLVRYGDFVADLAKREGATVADLNAPVVEATKKAKEIDAKLAIELNHDRIHPGQGGQLLMAENVLKAWNAPSLVSSVVIDAAEPTPSAKGEKAEVKEPKLDGEGVLRWEQVDECLPFPIDFKDQVVALAVKASDVVQALDQQTLKVVGLKADSYLLKIDDQDVGTFGRDELAAGINLADKPTPMLAQAEKVHALTLKHTDIHHKRWRQVQVAREGEPAEKVKGDLDALDAEEAKVVDEQRAAARPVAHRFVLSPKK